MTKADFKEISSILALALLATIAALTTSAVNKLSAVGDIEFLVNELTTTAERQQKALDRLAEYDDESLICLFPYFKDKRQIASTDVKFLNTSPTAFEKYFYTGGERVDQVLVQYYCWRTAQCALDSDEAIEKSMRQLEIDFKTQAGATAGANSVPCRNELVRHIEN
jgi:hypothetical protein